MEHTNISIILA